MWSQAPPDPSRREHPVGRAAHGGRSTVPGSRGRVTPTAPAPAGWRLPRKRASRRRALGARGGLVNQPAFGFGRALGLYIAIFFVVSQAVALAVLGERPSPSLLLGGALIVAGGLVVQLGRGWAGGLGGRRGGGR